MTTVRRPFLVVTVVLLLVAFAIEAGSRLWIVAPVQSAVAPDGTPRPGLGIPSLAVVDLLLVVSTTIVALVAIGVPPRIVGRVQGIATAIIAFLSILAAIGLLFAAIGLLILMVGLLMSVPFGTAIYMGAFGSFPRGAAAGTLGLLLALKLVAALCLVLGTFQALKARSLVLMFLTSIGLTLLLTFLHGLPPRFLASITDAVGAIIAFILAIIWGIVYLVGGIISFLKNLRLDRLGSSTVTPR